jgi:hypothetical protein
VDAEASVDIEADVGVAGDPVAIIVGNAAGLAVGTWGTDVETQPARNTMITPRRIARENGWLSFVTIGRLSILR